MEFEFDSKDKIKTKIINFFSFLSITVSIIVFFLIERAPKSINFLQNDVKWGSKYYILILPIFIIFLNWFLWELKKPNKIIGNFMNYSLETQLHYCKHIINIVFYTFFLCASIQLFALFSSFGIFISNYKYLLALLVAGFIVHLIPSSLKLQNLKDFEEKK